MKRIIYQILFPLTTALIWGISFVAQSESAEHIGAFTFSAARCFMAFLALLLLVPLLRRLSQTHQPELTAAEKKTQRKGLIWGGFCCGTALAVALRFVCHFITGWWIWDALWPNEFGWASPLYSLLYNGAYMLPEIIITAVVAVLLTKTPLNKYILAEDLK